MEHNKRGGSKRRGRRHSSKTRGTFHRRKRPTTSKPSKEFLAALAQQRRNQQVSNATEVPNASTNRTRAAGARQENSRLHHSLASSSSKYVWDSATNRYYAKHEPGDVPAIPVAIGQSFSDSAAMTQRTSLNLSRLIMAREIGGSVFSPYSRSVYPSGTLRMPCTHSYLRLGDPRKLNSHYLHFQMHTATMSKRRCRTTQWFPSTEMIFAPRSDGFESQRAMGMVWSKTESPRLCLTELDTGHLSQQGEFQELPDGGEVMNPNWGQLVSCCWTGEQEWIGVIDPKESHVGLLHSQENEFVLPTASHMFSQTSQQRRVFSLVIKQLYTPPRLIRNVIETGSTHSPSSIAHKAGSDILVVSGNDELLQLQSTSAQSCGKVPNYFTKRHVVCQSFVGNNQNVLLVGCRNGVIRSWDIRTNPLTSFSLFKSPVISSVHHLHELNRVGGGDRVVGIMNNSSHFDSDQSLQRKGYSNIVILDRRKPMSDPVCCLHRHKSDHRLRRNVYLNPDQRFLLAGGSDGILRAWDTTSERLVFETNMQGYGPATLVTGISTSRRYMHIWVATEASSPTTAQQDRLVLCYMRTRG